MSEITEPPVSPPAPNAALPTPPPGGLDKRQRRILGVLVEKAICTPDQYPLTANAIVTGCNQKSNRDPMTNFTADQIDEALLDLHKIGLVVRIQPATGRTDRWKHYLKEAWVLDRAERAVLAELLLRGAQTEGELRARASRMVDIASLEELRTILDRLKDRGFVIRLSPEGRGRGVAWTHAFFAPTEIEEQRARLGGDNGDEPAPRSPATLPFTPRAKPQAASEEGDARMAKLEADLAAIRLELDKLRADLDSVLR